MRSAALRSLLLLLTLTGQAWAQSQESAAAQQPLNAVAAPAAPITNNQPTHPPALPLRAMPATQPYRGEELSPPGYVLDEQVRRPFVIGGAAAIGAGYISGLIVGGVLGDFPNKSIFLVIPAAGPWITLATRKTCTPRPDVLLDCAGDDLAQRLLIADGLVQTIGVGLLVTGFVWTKSIWLREDLANINLVTGLNVAALPGAPPPQGVSIVGHF